MSTCTGRIGQDAGEMMMQRAALIVGIGGAVIVVTAILVHMVVMSVSSGAGAGHVGSDVLFAGHDVLKVEADQRHDAGQLGDHIEAQQPAAKSALDVQRHHPNGLIRLQEYQVRAPEMVAEKSHRTSNRWGPVCDGSAPRHGQAWIRSPASAPMS